MPDAAMQPEAAMPDQLRQIVDHRSVWLVSRKLDGDRVLGANVDGAAIFWNRHGERYSKRVPAGVAAFLEMLPANLVWDGELVDGRWHLFDVLLPGKPLTERLDVLYKIGVLAELNAAPVELVPHYADGKAEMVASWMAFGAEGFVAKRADSTYQPGKTRAWVKVKFVRQLDCIVLGRGAEKDNLTLGLVCDEPPATHKCSPFCRPTAGLHEVGRVSALTGDGPQCDVGDVVTVTVLDVSEDHRLIQPVKPRLRPGDVQPVDCTWDLLDACRKQR